MNYTTKPVEFPLSTEKEYILVDVDEFKASAPSAAETIQDYDVLNPFKLDSIVCRDGLIGGWYIIQDIIGQSKYFREVIRNKSDGTESDRNKSDGTESDRKERDELLDDICEELFGELASQCREDVVSTIDAMLDAGFRKTNE